MKTTCVPFRSYHDCTKRKKPLRNKRSKGNNSEGAIHDMGKDRVLEWLASQESVMQQYTEAEKTLKGRNAGRRPDIQTVVRNCLDVVFEVQRSSLQRDKWHERHIQGYGDSGVRDIWLWTPSVVPSGYEPGRLLDMIIIDPCKRLFGLPVVITDTVEPYLLDGIDLSDKRHYIHPMLLPHQPRPTHVVYASMSDWKVDDDGNMVPPQYFRDEVDYGQIAHELSDPNDERQIMYGLWSGSSVRPSQAWEQLLDLARSRRVLELTDGAGLARLSGPVVIADRTRGFSSKEYEKNHPLYTKDGRRAVWLVNANQPIDPSLYAANPDSFLEVLHPETPTPYVRVRTSDHGVRKYSLDAAIDHILGLDIGHHPSSEIANYDDYPAGNESFVKMLKTVKGEDL